MKPLIRQNRVVADEWRHIDDTQPLPDTGPCSVSLERWKAEHRQLLEHPDRLGVRLGPQGEPADLADTLDDLALIVVEFPAFTDGRGFSQARQLRVRLGYQGELRAYGPLLRDQLPMLAHCGFDSFDLTTETDLEQALRAFNMFTVDYSSLWGRSAHV
ncbi:MAG: DUF934 domain-containing protein [Candidatus Competibacterales bacterium]|nr:DUF934 domain-containing protein [Candidatus Competibacterales bacterium]